MTQISICRDTALSAVKVLESQLRIETKKAEEAKAECDRILQMLREFRHVLAQPSAAAEVALMNSMDKVFNAIGKTP